MDGMGAAEAVFGLARGAVGGGRRGVGHDGGGGKGGRDADEGGRGDGEAAVMGIITNEGAKDPG